jgi:hypothetical protein
LCCFIPQTLSTICELEMHEAQLSLTSGKVRLIDSECFKYLINYAAKAEHIPRLGYFFLPRLRKDCLLA